MAMKRITVDEFVQLSQQYPIADVRSPSEFAHAHIPGAFSLPLFNDEERKVVGTTYKQQSREDAIKIGLDYFGPNMKKIILTVEDVLKKRNNKTILVHCWRGGMRSAAIAWLLDLYGFKVYTLEGGYKAYRNWVLKQFEVSYPLQIVGGYTGSAKTETLQMMQKKGAVVIDLEALANHKGSAFGNLGMPVQPSVEMFENNLITALRHGVEQLNANSHPCIWLESESQRIGNINIPTSFFKQMKAAPYVFVDITFEKRLAFILSSYGKFEKIDLVNAILRIKKRLGGLETKTAINFLLEDNVEACFEILLKYYDKYYERSKLADEQHLIKIQLPDINPEQNAQVLMEWKNQVI